MAPSRLVKQAARWWTADGLALAGVASGVYTLRRFSQGCTARAEMLPILYFIDQYLIDLFIWIIIGSAILSWLIAFNVVNPYNQFVRSLWDLFHRVTEPFLRPIRRLMPDLGGIDISPVVLILILIFIRVVVIRGWLMPLFA